MSSAEDAGRVTAEGYNYRDFVGDASQGDFEAFMGRPHVGAKMPDGVLTPLGDADPVALSSLWRESHLVLEFGSYG